MSQVSCHRLLVVLIVLVLAQKGFEVYSWLEPIGTEIALLDGTRVLVHDQRPVSPSRDDFKPGDTLVFMNGRVIRDWHSLKTIYGATQTVSAAGIQVRRMGRNAYLILDPQGLEFHRHPDQVRLSESLAYLFSYLSSLTIFGAGVLVFASHPIVTRTAIFLALSATLTLRAGEIPYGIDLLWRVPSEILLFSANALSPALFLHFFLTYPQALYLPRRRNWLVLIYLWGAPSLFLRLADRFLWWMGHLPSNLVFLALPLEYFYTVLCFVLAALGIAYSYYRGNPDEKRKLRWMILAIVMGLLPGVFASAVLPVFIALDPEQSVSVQMLLAPLTVVFPLASSYPQLRPRVVNLRRVWRAIIMALASAWPLRLLLLLPGAPIVRMMLQENRADPWQLLVLFSLLIILSRIRGFSEDAVDRLLFRTFYQARQKLLKLREHLIFANSSDSIWNAVGNTLAETLAGAKTYIFIWEESARCYQLGYAQGIHLTAPAGSLAREKSPQLLRALSEMKSSDPTVRMTLRPLPKEYGKEPDTSWKSLATCAIQQESSLLALLRRSENAVTLGYEFPNDLGNMLPSSERELLFRLGIALVLPIRDENYWAGLLALSEKKTQEAYTRSEINSLKALMPVVLKSLQRLNLVQSRIS